MRTQPPLLRGGVSPEFAAILTVTITRAKDNEYLRTQEKARKLGGVSDGAAPDAFVY